MIASRLSAVVLCCMTLTGCLLYCVPSIPGRPRPDLESIRSEHRIPARVVVLIEQEFENRRFERFGYSPQGNRGGPGGDWKVEVGKSSVRALQEVLPRFFQEVEFVGPRSPPLPECDFVLVPRISEVVLRYVPEISYAVAVYRREGTELVEIETLSASGRSSWQRSALERFTVGFVELIVSLATGAFGTFDNIHLARTFASAQEAAFQDLVSQLPDSQLAREARSQLPASRPTPTGQEDSSSGAERTLPDGPPEKPQQGNPATDRTLPQSSTPTMEGP